MTSPALISPFCKTGPYTCVQLISTPGDNNKQRTVMSNAKWAIWALLGRGKQWAWHVEIEARVTP